MLFITKIKILNPIFIKLILTKLVFFYIMSMFNLFIIFPPMKLQRIKSGFTLIELLVVITIIGILATWAVSVYTSQIQKSRDSVRITDLKALQWGIEQFYQDKWEYPTPAVFSWVTAYVPTMPSDPKTGQASANSVFEYLYNVSADSNTIANQEYEVSCHFEQSWNITWKAETDWWNDLFRLEQGINISDTDQSTIVSRPAWIVDSAAKYTCLSAVWAEWTACWAAAPMLIRK